MKNKKLITLFVLLIATELLYAKNIVNFFINYNIITFSGFEKIIQFNSQNNIPQYIEYNEIIPVYLVWKGKKIFNVFKKNIKNNKIKFFRINKNRDIKNKQKLWFFQEKEKFRKKIFSNLVSEENITYITIKTDFINIFNFIELEKILSTVSAKTQLQELNFKLDLKLFLYSNISNFFEIINKFTNNIQYNFYIVSDVEYEASKNEIEEFIDTVYSIKIKKNLIPAEKKIFNLSLLFFTLNLSSSLKDILLNLFPLTSILPRRYRISSTEYEINNRKYITLFDRENFFIFDTKNTHLKKWFHYKSGTALINFDSLIEKIYIASRKRKNFNSVVPKNVKYIRFSNGINFKISFTENLEVEKNIILQNQHLFLSYKIKNCSSRKKYYIFSVENKFLPSLYNILINLESNISLYDIGKKYRFAEILSGTTRGIVNMNTGYGIYIDTYNKMEGIEIFKGLYYYNYIVYYRFSLYPYESKVITLTFRKIYFSQKRRKRYLNKLFNIKDQRWGICWSNK